jgi:hypothetical protein
MKAEKIGNNLLILERDNRKCFYCDLYVGRGKNLTFNYIVHKSKGGERSVTNLVVCCKKCNVERGKKDFLEFLKSLNLSEEDFNKKVNIYNNMLSFTLKVKVLEKAANYCWNDRENEYVVPISIIDKVCNSLKINTIDFSNEIFLLETDEEYQRIVLSNNPFKINYNGLSDRRKTAFIFRLLIKIINKKLINNS